MATTAPEQSLDSRYAFLVQNILGSFSESGGICLVVGDLSVDGGLLRHSIEQIYKGLWVFEVPCRQGIASRIIPDLAHLVSSAMPRRPDAPALVASAGVTTHAPMLFICDGADDLGDEQLDAMYNLSRGSRGPLGVVLIAKPDFLRRLENSRLNHITSALSACLWSQRSSYGAHFIAGPQGKKAGLPAVDVALPSPLLETAIKQDVASSSAHNGALRARSAASAVLVASQISAQWRRRILHMCFSAAYLLIAAGTADLLSHISNLHTQTDSVAVKTYQLSRSEASSALEGRSSPQIASAFVPRQSSSRSGGAAEQPKPSQSVHDRRSLHSESDQTEEQFLSSVKGRSVGELPDAASSKAGLVKNGPSEALKPKDNVVKGPGALANLPEKIATPVGAGEPTSPKRRAVPVTSESSEDTKLANAAPGPTQEKSVPERELALSDTERALFVQRGEELLSEGDIASARLFFERAANAGDARAAFEMAKTFDPTELTKVGARGVKGDQAQADLWYQRAHLLAGNKDHSGPYKRTMP